MALTFFFINTFRILIDQEVVFHRGIRTGSLLHQLSSILQLVGTCLLVHPHREVLLRAHHARHQSSRTVQVGSQTSRCVRHSDLSIPSVHSDPELAIRPAHGRRWLSCLERLPLPTPPPPSSVFKGLDDDELGSFSVSATRGTRMTTGTVGGLRSCAILVSLSSWCRLPSHSGRDVHRIPWSCQAILHGQISHLLDPAWFRNTEQCCLREPHHLSLVQSSNAVFLLPFTCYCSSNHPA